MKRCLLLALFMVCLSGCAGKMRTEPPVPLPPQQLEQAEPAPAKDKRAEFASPPYADDEAAQYVVASLPKDQTAEPRRDEPAELADILEMKSGLTAKDGAVSLMRPNAIKEAAQLVAFQTAIAYRYRQLVAATEEHSAIMDTAFNFGPLLMTQGEALILPPVLARAGASMRIENPDTATTAQTTYEILAPARYVSAAPNWREFLMVDSFPQPEKPNPALLPQNVKERAIWRAAGREAWARGLAEADELYADNVARMVRQYRGVMLYHLLTAQHLLSMVNAASANLGMKTSSGGEKLNIGQKIYRITAPSRFVIPGAEKARKRK
jgi:hypothetical protein